jgi:hypothetical protein
MLPQIFARLLPLLSLTLANPLIDRPLEARQVEYTPKNSLVRRGRSSIENSGQTPENTPSLNITVTVPLNNGASSNSSITGHHIIIPNSHLVARPYALGGGDPETFMAGTFKEWKAGQGTRNEIYGTARYGSGFGTYVKTESGTYKYELDLNLNVRGRHHWPHGFAPIVWGALYSGNGEYDYIDHWGNLMDYPGTIDSPPSNTIEESWGPPIWYRRFHAILAQKGN